MTTANLSVVPWANAGFKVDPDTDTSHPSAQGGPGKVAKGWIIETEPQQWENYWINLYARKMMDRVTNGIHQIDQLVTYKANSLVWDVNGKIYLAKSANTNNLTTNTTYWQEAMSYSQDAWLVITNKMATDLTAHVPAGVVKHGETAATVSGKTTSAIDTQVAAQQARINAHIPLQYPHGESAIQCGTIPATGGQFDGQIEYKLGFSMSDFNEISVCAQTEIAGMGTPDGAAFGVGNSDWLEGGRIQEIISDYLSAEVNANQLFTSTQPDIFIPMVSDILTRNCGLSTSFIRGNTLAYTDKGGTAQVAAANVPPFEALGMKMDGSTQFFVATGLNRIMQATVVFNRNGVKTFWRGQFDGQNMQNIWGPTGNIRNVRVWYSYLTDRQIASLP